MAPSSPTSRDIVLSAEQSMVAHDEVDGSMDLDGSNHEVESIRSMASTPLTPPITPQNAGFQRSQTSAPRPRPSDTPRCNRSFQSSTSTRVRARIRSPRNSPPTSRSPAQHESPGETFRHPIEISDDDPMEDVVVYRNMPGSYPESPTLSRAANSQRGSPRNSVEPPEDPDDIITTPAAVQSAAAIDEKIRKALLKPLKLSSYSTQGSIYIWSAPDHPNLFKIGRSETPQERLTNQSRRCNLALKHLDIPHTHFLGCKRAEALIHTELANFRVRAPPCGCGVVHREWFEVPEDVAVEVVARWTLFVGSGPYEEIGRDGERELKRMYQSRLHSMPRPLEAVETPLDHERRKDRWRKVLLASDCEFMVYHVSECARELRWQEWTLKGFLFRLLLVGVVRTSPSFFNASLALILGSAVADTGLFR